MLLGFYWLVGHGDCSPFWRLLNSTESMRLQLQPLSYSTAWFGLLHDVDLNDRYLPWFLPNVYDDPPIPKPIWLIFCTCLTCSQWPPRFQQWHVYIGRFRLHSKVELMLQESWAQPEPPNKLIHALLIGCWPFPKTCYLLRPALMNMLAILTYFLQLSLLLSL